jgi:ABC-2 type transport system ATP-binding protein
MLVSEYLSFCADLRNVPKKEKASKMDKVIERCQLKDVRNRLIGNLSKGYRQRVGIAQAMIHDPEVLVLDEPTIGLDPKQVSEARTLIKSMKNERTVIYSTHILSEVAATCDRIIIINKGKIVAQESINEMGSTGETTRTEIIVKKVNETLIGKIKNISGVKNVTVQANGSTRLVIESEAKEELLAEISKVIVEQNAGLIRMSPVQHALEDYYLSGELFRRQRKNWEKEILSVSASPRLFQTSLKFLRHTSWIPKRLLTNMLTRPLLENSKAPID